jgi:membrane protease YdiL (CAAX protease family)
MTPYAYRHPGHSFARHRLREKLHPRPLRTDSYLAATRHPWACFLFLLPLLAAYEGGVLWVGGAQPEALRNGADTWLRWGLEAFGLNQLYWAPALLAGFFLVRSCCRWHDRPEDTVGVWLGMAIESVVLALVLWGLSRGLGPALDEMGVTMDVVSDDCAAAQVLTFVGAGIYEETLFRLLLYSGLVGCLRLLYLPRVLAYLLAAIFSAMIFAAAHHVGPYGETFDDYVFLFRSLAGLFFALLYQSRGLGVAVGTHACYDVLVGMAVG